MAKILLISHIFPPAIDGGSRVIYKIGQYFEKQNNQVLYLSSDCSSTDDFTKKVKTHCPVEGRINRGCYLPVYHHLRRPLKLINIFLPKSSYLYQLLQIFQKGPIFKFFPFLKTTFRIIKFKPDLIIAGPLPTAIILYANFLKKVTHSQLLINASFHPTDPDFHRKPLIKTLQSADYLWTLTQYETDYFIQNFNIDHRKIILAGNGVDDSFLKNTNTSKIKKIPAEGNLNILFIGSLSAHKGVDTLINSFSQLRESNKHLPKINLIIAGQKTLYYPQIKNQISHLPKYIQSKIKFIFSFPQDKLAKIIDNSDILILPSKQESFGLCLIESLARQKPVIVSDIPQLSELIKNSQGGLTFKLNDSNDLAQKILKLANDPKLRYQLGQNGFNYVKNNYTWSIVGNKIKERLGF